MNGINVKFPMIKKYNNPNLIVQLISLVHEMWV